jgi:flagellar motor switch protein FliM
MAGTAGGILRRKLKAAGARGYGFPGQARLAASLELATARSVTASLGVPVEAVTERALVTGLAGLLEALPEPGLYALIELEGGKQAMLGLDAALVDHVVDILAGGDPEEPRPVSARAPTPIDSALCRGVAEALLGAVDAELGALAGAAVLGRVRWRRAEPLLPGLQFELPERQYLVLGLALDIGDGARGGRLHLALPLAAIEPVEAVLRRSGPVAGPDESEGWSRHMRAVVRRTPLRLKAVLDRGRMPVGELSRLEVGGLFPLSELTLDDVVLELETGGATRRLARGRLGSYRRQKAVRLAEPPDPAFLGPLAALLGIVPAPEPDAEPPSGRPPAGAR